MNKFIDSILKHPFAAMMLIMCTTNCVTNVVKAVKGKDVE